MKTLKKINWKLFFTLVAVSVVTSLMVMPFTFALIELPEEVPMTLLVVAQTIQVAIILSISTLCGLTLLKKTELTGFLVLEDFLDGKKLTKNWHSIVKEAILWGFAGGILSVILCIPFWKMSVDLLMEEMNVDLWKSVLACFYGGIGEEVIFRLGMMTFLIWVFGKCRLKKSAYWLAIIVTGIIFGLGHLGITGSMTAITADVIIRAVLLNGSLSVIYGILYWKRGFESAMIAHFSTDIVLHILIPHVIAPFFL